MPSRGKSGKGRHGIRKVCCRAPRVSGLAEGTVTGVFALAPWAWTLNDRGEGLFFDDRESALAYLTKAVADPEHSVDVLHADQHEMAFEILKLAMLDPTQNADWRDSFSTFMRRTRVGTMRSSITIPPRRKRMSAIIDAYWRSSNASSRRACRRHPPMTWRLPPNSPTVPNWHWSHVR